MKNSYKSIEINCAKNTHEEVFKLITKNKLAKIIDIPCGFGAFIKRLNDAGYSNVFGLDIQNILKFKFSNFLTGSMNEKLPIASNSFDCVVCIDGIEHIDEQFQFIREIKRILINQGELIISTPNISSLGSRWRWFLSGHHNKCKAPLDENNPNPLHHIGMMSFQELRYILHSNGFKISNISSNRIKPVNYLFVVFLPLIILYTALAYKRSSKRDGNKKINKEIFYSMLSPNVLFGESLIIKAIKK